jgi:hypothetical protein
LLCLYPYFFWNAAFLVSDTHPLCSCMECVCVQKEACRVLIGHHDFSSFRAAGCQVSLCLLHTWHLSSAMFLGSPLESRFLVCSTVSLFTVEESGYFPTLWYDCWWWWWWHSQKQYYLFCRHYLLWRHWMSLMCVRPQHGPVSQLKSSVGPSLQHQRAARTRGKVCLGVKTWMWMLMPRESYVALLSQQGPVLFYTIRLELRTTIKSPCYTVNI